MQYGGVSATDVGPIAGGPTGWLITGNRTSGPGAWFTDDPREFTRVEAEPGLTDDGDWQEPTVSTGDHYELWQTGDGRTWRQVDVPLEPPTAGDHSVMAVAGDDVLLVGDAGDGGHVWVGQVSP